MRDIVLASNNAGKIRELEALLAPHALHILPQKSLGIADIEETGATFIENALLKARHAARESGKPALADDSGLVVPALGGQPGIYSARYAGRHGDDDANNRKLLQMLEGSADRRAAFVCTIVLLKHADDPLPLTAQGIWHGEILTAPRSGQGFGYDPVFRPQGFKQSAAELGHEEKNRHSHRARALQALLARYQNEEIFR